MDEANALNAPSDEDRERQEAQQYENVTLCVAIAGINYS
jgi:hypothetical protein